MATRALLASDLAGGYRQGRGGEDGRGILGRVRHAYKLPEHPWWSNKVPQRHKQTARRTSPSHRGCLSNLDSKPREVKGGPRQKTRGERDKPHQLPGGSEPGRGGVGRSLRGVEVEMLPPIRMDFMKILTRFITHKMLKGMG